MHNLIPFLIQHGYTVLFVWVLAETMGLPLPSVPLLITVGALAGLGQMKADARSSSSLNRKPNNVNEPTQKSAPIQSKNRKCDRGMRIIPANGVDMMLSPGTNLATRRDRAPYREKMFSVRRTQESVEMVCDSRGLKSSWEMSEGQDNGRT